jgi:hypothetical protein
VIRARRLLAALVLLFSGGAQIHAAKADASLEYAVKAAYLPKFIPFIRWPDSAFAGPGAAVTICVLGDDPFGPRLDQAVRATAGERPVQLRRLAEFEPDAGCHLIFMAAATDAALVQRTLSATRGRPVVTVTDSSSGPRGIISFVIQANHVRFDIDDALAAQGGLTISSKLLGLARMVKQRGQP